MRVLVTGGSGFLGAALCRELVAAGDSVRVLDDHSRGRPHRLRDLGSAVEVIEGDVRDASTVGEALRGCSTVWHLAAINGTRNFYERPDEVIEVGIAGTLNVIEGALREGVKRFVLAGSAEAYHIASRFPTPESERLVIPDVRNPRVSYAASKIAGEALALHLGMRRGLEVVICRPHNIYGPDMGFEHVIPEIVGRLAGAPRGGRVVLSIQGDGSETRAFCHVRDGATGFHLAGRRGVSGEIYHVGTEHEVSVACLIGSIGRALGVEIEIAPGPLRDGSPTRRVPSIAKLAALGYEPRVGFEEGVAEVARWYAEHPLGVAPAR